MKYKVGQKIICIENKSWCKLSLKPGEVYTVKRHYQCPCGSRQYILAEVYFKIHMICQCGHAEYRNQSFYEWRFRPYVMS